jgi:hypothetical protein
MCRRAGVFRQFADRVEKTTLRTRRLGRGHATAALLPMRRHTGDDYRRLRDLAFFSLIQTGA